MFVHVERMWIPRLDDRSPAPFEDDNEASVCINTTWAMLQKQCGLVRCKANHLYLTDFEASHVANHIPRKWKNGRKRFVASVFVLARIGKLGGSFTLDMNEWWSNGLSYANILGFPCTDILTPVEIENLCAMAKPLKHPWQVQVNPNVVSLMENPTAFLEEQDYATKYKVYVNHLSYCQYGKFNKFYLVADLTIC